MLDCEEYERLLEIEDEMEDLAALRAAREARRASEAGDDELIFCDDAMEEIRTGKASTE